MPGGKDKFLNSVQALAIRKQDQGDTSDLGMVNFENLEIGMEDEPLRFDYAIHSTGGPPDLTAAYHAGAAFNIPMIAVRMLPRTAPAKPVDSFFAVDAANVVLTAFRPSIDGDPNHYMLRLQEIAGKQTEVAITTALKISQAEQTNLSEDEVVAPQALPLKLKVGPNQTVTLRVTIPHQTKSRSNRWWEWN
jgi:alpha-mannosidase